MESQSWFVETNDYLICTQVGWFRPKKNLPNNTRACTLIDEKNGKWIEDRVLSEFVPHEAIAILGLPLSSTHAEDRLIWTTTRDGCYSTKSTYQLFSKEEAVKALGQSNTIDHKQFWLDIWSQNLPNKIWYLLWWASNDSLPTKLNLMKRNIIANSLCDRCCCETEDTIHAIWDYTEVKKTFVGSWSGVNHFWQKNWYVSVICFKEF